MFNAVLNIVIPGLWFAGYDVEKDKEVDFLEGKEKCQNLMDTYAIMITVFGLFAIFTFRNKPKTPPCFVA